jgi:dimethylargininase
MLVAVTRAVSEAFNQCELTHVARETIDVALARSQHRAYERALEGARCEIARVEPAPGLPDSVFVEDTAIVVDEIAIIARPGAVSRQAETRAVADVLRQYRELRHVEAPGTIDGGDVVFAGRRVFIGRSSRTNDAGIAQVRRILQPFGYDVTGVEVRGCLHLKSAATPLSENQLLVNPAWISREAFAGVELLEIDPGEPYAANILRAGDDLVYSSSFPRTRDWLERSGVPLTIVDVSEIAKAEGAVTCCSLIFTGDAAALGPQTPGSGAKQISMR